MPRGKLSEEAAAMKTFKDNKDVPGSPAIFVRSIATESSKVKFAATYDNKKP